jgi:hypothetical protein
VRSTEAARNRAVTDAADPRGMIVSGQGKIAGTE